VLPPRAASCRDAKGTGLLTVRKPKTEGGKPYIACTTDTGRSLYQAYIPKHMRPLVSDKQFSVAFTAPGLLLGEQKVRRGDCGEAALNCSARGGARAA
jgi:hypothetical protein